MQCLAWQADKLISSIRVSVISSRVTKPDMDEFLLSCKTFSKRGTRPVVQSCGAYVGLFGVTPSEDTSTKGIDVLTYGFARHQVRLMSRRRCCRR